VFALLGILALQVATGLVADDEIVSTGPAHPVRQLGDGRRGDAPGTRSYGRWIVLGLVALHLGAIAF
jgi:hypothetical protein